MRGRSAREMAEDVSRARRRQERGALGAWGDGLRLVSGWLRRRAARLLIGLVLVALGAVIGIVAFPLLPAETRDFVERLVGA